MTFTKAAFATHLAVIARTAVMAQAGLAQGMWNPNFCSSSATDIALSICEDLEATIKQIRKHIREAALDHQQKEDQP
jgi:hypothetical protein